MIFVGCLILNNTKKNREQYKKEGNQLIILCGVCGHDAFKQKDPKKLFVSGDFLRAEDFVYMDGEDVPMFSEIICKECM